VKELRRIAMGIMMITLLFTLVTPVIATESITDEDYYVTGDSEGAGLQVTFGKGDNERNLVIWSFNEFDDENEDHQYQDTEQLVATYSFGPQSIYAEGKHLAVDDNYLWYRAQWNDGTKLEVRLYINQPHLEIRVIVLKYEMIQAWNDLTVVYEVDDKSKHAAFEYQSGEVIFTEKLNPNFIDRLLESLPF
jgi:hypothetical protein